MIECTLHTHPSAHAAQMRVSIERSRVDGIELHYDFPASARLPERSESPRRCDDLWQHTCAELFIRSESGTAYREFNFSPSGDWACYDFTDYRLRTAADPDISPPQIVCRAHENGWRVSVTLSVSLKEPVQIGLSAVVESTDNTLHYFALHHPADRPDFHHAGGFVLTL
jgi:hypothetical protein